MVLGSGVIAHIEPMEFKGTSNNIRSDFAKKLPKQQLILYQHNQIISGVDLFYQQMYDACVSNGMSDQYQVAYTDDANMLLMPFIFKYKDSRSKVKPLKDYAAYHVRSSLIKTVLLTEGTLNKRIDEMMYLLYYYWFMRSETMSKITNSVIVEIESIISQLISKAFTTYKDYNTISVVDALRNKLQKEKLINLGDSIYV